jgi:hypothetical protein
VKSVIKGTQIGVHLLLQIAGQETEALAGLNRRSGQDKTLYPPLLQHPDRLHRGQEGLSGARRTNGQGEVMAFHRIDETLLAQRSGPQGTPPDAGGEHLTTEIAMFVPAAAVKGRKRRLNVHRCDRFTALPQGPEQLEQGGRPLNLS